MRTDRSSDAGGRQASGVPSRQLSAQERAVLDFERSWWLEGSAKEPLIRERLGMSATRYYKALAALIDMPEALAYDPLVVRRLRRMRDRRRRARFEAPAQGRPGR
ncbi:MAG TPA: DUF3263 domain-containing protein [Acidimicrobiales bacterium]